MNQPSIAKENRRFIPPSARITPTGAIVSLIVGIAVTAFSWLWLETSGPAIALACGASAGGLVLVAINRERRRRSPPSLVIAPDGLKIEDRTERIVIPWSELAEVRCVTDDVERLEFRSTLSEEPFVLVVDHFSPDQADEIKRAFLRDAA